MATYTRPISATFIRSGLAGTIGYTIKSTDGTTLVPRTTAGITEDGTSGVYSASVANWDTSWSGLIRWDDGSGGVATDTFLAYNPAPSLPAVDSNGRVLLQPAQAFNNTGQTDNIPANAKQFGGQTVNATATVTVPSSIGTATTANQTALSQQIAALPVPDNASITAIKAKTDTITPPAPGVVVGTGTVAASPAPTAISFSCPVGSLNATSGAYVGQSVIFQTQSGPLYTERRPIVGYTVANGVASFTFAPTAAFTGAPATGEVFAIL